MVLIDSMMRFSSRKNHLLILLLFFISTPLLAFDRLSYAKSLEEDGDWYRAIGIHKELRFETHDEAEFWKQTQFIVFDLWSAKQYQEGINELTRLKDQIEKAPTTIKDAAYSWIGLFQYKLNRLTSAEYFWTSARNDLYLGLLFAKTKRVAEARKSWQGLNLPDPEITVEDSKNPLIASALSCIVPGAGQIYSGHWSDGIQAFAFVGVFGFTTYEMYLYDSHFSNNYALTIVSAGITLFFEASNIYGAYKTAEFFNENQNIRKMESLETVILSKRLPTIQ